MSMLMKHLHNPKSSTLKKSCVNCLMEHQEIVPLRNDHSCPCCEVEHLGKTRIL